MDLVPDEAVVFPVEPSAVLLDVLFDKNEARLPGLLIVRQVFVALRKRLHQVFVREVHEEPLKPNQVVFAVLEAATVKVLNEGRVDFGLRELNVTLVL